MPGAEESNATVCCRHGFKSEDSCPLCGSDVFALADNNKAAAIKKSSSDRQTVEGNAAGSHASQSNEGLCSSVNDYGVMTAPTAKEVPPIALGGGWPALEQSLLQSESSAGASSTAAAAASPEASREEAFVDSLAGMDRVLELREELGRAFSSGTFNIAQARYSMGSGRVGQAQYPSRILPSSSVSTTGALPDLRYSLQVTAVDCTGSTVGVTAAASDSAAPTTTAARDDQEHNHEDEKCKTSGSGGVGDQQQGQQQQQRNAQKTPLKWFGVAVPPSLRAAESDFRAVLELLPKLAEAQLQVQRAATKYKMSNEESRMPPRPRSSTG